MQVTRQRRRASRVRLGWFGGSSRRLRIALAGAAVVVLAGAGLTYASTGGFGNNQVGTQYADGLQVSDNQILDPLGVQVIDHEIMARADQVARPDHAQERNHRVRHRHRGQRALMFQRTPVKAIAQNGIGQVLR